MENVSPRLPSMQLRSIDIRTAPGIPHGFRIDGFAPGINIITGPNASGKSTTSRLLRQLFWSRDAETEADYRVAFRYADSDWNVRRAGNHIGCDRDGAATALPAFHDYGDELRERYHLPLHDLLVADDTGFAALVAREAAGGYDLEAAIKRLGFNASPPQPLGLARTLDEAKQQLKAANDAQRALLGEEEQLVDLKIQSQKSLDAAGHLQLLDRIAVAVAARADAAAAGVVFEGFPKILERFRGDEGEQLRQLDEQEAKLHLDRARIQQSRDEAEQELAAARVSPGDQLRVDIDTLDGYRETLVAVDRELANLTIRRSDLQRRADQARADAAANLSEDQIVPQGLELLSNLAHAIDRRNEKLNEFAAHDALARWVGEFEETEDLNKLRDGIRHLRDWLRAPTPEFDAAARRNAYVIMGAALVVAGSAVALGIWAHPVGYALLAVAAALFAYGIVATRGLAKRNIRDDAQAKFAGLRIGSIDSWEPHLVEELLGDLETGLQNGVLEQQKAQRWGDLDQKRKAAQQLAFELTARTNELQTTLGAAFELDEHSIGLVSGRIKVWVEASDSLIACDGAMAAALERRADLLERFNGLGARYELPVADSAVSAVSVVATLKDRERIAIAAIARIQQADAQLRDVITPQFDRIAGQRDEIRDRVGVDDLDEITALWSERPEWEKASKALELADGAFAIQQAQLGDDVDLDAWDESRIASERTESTLKAAQYPQTMERISAIEARIDQAKSGNTVDRALIAVDRAATKLEENRRDAVASGIGDWIAGKVREESDESNLPQVVKVAQRLFSQITLGRFDLRFKPGATPSFTAVETSSGEALTLQQLSSATRVQLLLSVRMAFIEMGERTAKLPVMLDETLANADESRAHALIESVFELSRNGRQIFYFTAQAEEVAKWQAISALYADVPFAISDLSQARGSSSPNENASLRLTPLRRVRPPAPNGHTRDEYRAVLNVPTLDRWATSAGEAHLWYLVSDPDALHGYLDRDVTTWGQFRSAFDRGGGTWLRATDDDYRKLAARAAVLSSMLEYGRVGHGRPCSRLELAGSPVGASSLLPQVGDLLDLCDGDAQALCTRLKNREVQGLRTKTVDDLETFCRERGYIVDDPKLATDEIRMRVSIDHRAPVEQGLLTDADIDRLFADFSTLTVTEPLVMQGIGE